MFKFLFLLFLLFIIQTPVFSYDYQINLSWFENFGDKNLTSYIYEGLNNNKDVEIAKKNILKSRQEKNLKISKEFPNVNVGADYLLLKVPYLAIPNNDIQKNSFALPFMMYYEVDWLLKNYNSIQKAKLDVENAMFDVKAANIAVCTEVAQAYFNVSNLDKQLDIQNKIVNLLDEIYRRKQKMFEYGVITALELNEAENLLYEEKNNFETLQKKREIFLTELSYMLGRSPYNLNEIEITPFDEINYKGIYPESFKGDIVLNRPDIMKLERELEKAKLDITIAKKDFLPNINIFGILVFSTIVQNFGWDGVFAALSAGAVQNLFDGGKRIFNLKKRKIEYDIAIEKYLKADILALKEVNDSLYALKRDLKIYANNENRLKNANANFIKIFNSFNEGTKSKLDYFEENRRYLKYDIDLSESKNQNYINLLTLFKAVGGAI